MSSDRLTADEFVIVLKISCKIMDLFRKIASGRNNSNESVRRRDSHAAERKKSVKEEETVIKQQREISIFSKFLKRLLFLGLMLVAVYAFTRNKEDPYLAFVKSDTTVQRRSFKVQCSEDYAEDKIKWEECVPKRCGRVVMDELILSEDVNRMLSIARKGFKFGGSNGGASILDLNSGALSKGDAFVNIYSLPEAKDLFTKEDVMVFSKIRNQIQTRIGMEFGVMPDKLYLTHPTFFSHMTSKPAKTIHDEYWHPHVDKETYETFHYTSLLYLGTYNENFSGGRFIFVDKDANRTIEPQKGRVSMFTSGSENLHFVEKVTSGERYAVTISFTCDKHSAIKDPFPR